MHAARSGPWPDASGYTARRFPTIAGAQTMFARLSAMALAAAVLLSSSGSASADALIKPVPVPDYSRLTPEKAKELREVRTIFEQKHAELAGDLLAEAYALLAAAYASNGFLQEASVAMENASLLAPKDGRWVYSRGVIAEEQKQLAVAQNFYDLALQLDKDYLPIRMAVVRGKIANGDLDGARKLLAEYVATHQDAAAYAALGDIALRQKRYDEAVRNLRRALALQPEATGLNRPLADALAAAGDAKGAADARAKAGNVVPGVADTLAAGLLGRSLPGTASEAAQPPAKDRADMDPAARLLAEALVLLDTGRYAEARAKLDEGLKSRPRDATLLALYARVEAADGRLDAAKARAAAAVAADRNNAMAHLSQGIALEMAGDDAGARSAYEQALRIAPDLDSALGFLGALLLRTGDASGAVRRYRELVRTNVHDQDNWIRLVGAYVVAGQCGEALKDIGDLVKRDMKNRFALQLYVRVASTCPAATAAERATALQMGADLYDDATPSPPNTEAYALALAANGRWEDAIRTQQAAIFLLVRNNRRALVPGYKETLAQFEAHKVPDAPWVRSAGMFNPQRLKPAPRAARAPAEKRK